MRVLRRQILVLPVVVGLFCAGIWPSRLLGDDKGTNDPPAKAEPTKPGSSRIDAPVPGLTERERWLLDRVEQLEKRVAELEAKGGVAPVTSAAVAGSNPVSPEPISTNVPAGASSVTPAPAAAELGANVIPASKAAASVVTQATEKSRSGMAKPAVSEPFAFADFTWLNGNARTKEVPMDTKFFTPEVRADISYIYDFNHPKDDTIGGSSEVFRSKEVQVTQLGVGGDFRYDNVRARLMTQFGMYSFTTPRNDASPARGQWDLDTAYRYVSEAYGGYHFNVLHGINVDAGIFMSYIGLFSYYNFDNWAYQPSFVSSNTPWFFNGVRIQIFPTEHLKIEPWFTNGWLTLGGGRINNPGRYLVLIPPINGATAPSAAINSPYFTENPGDPFKAWDALGTFDWMPSQYITFRWEFDHRAANVPYWSGAGGITPPLGNNGFPTQFVCMDGTNVAFATACGANGGTWFPDLRKIENRLDLAILVKF